MRRAGLPASLLLACAAAGVFAALALADTAPPGTTTDTTGTTATETTTTGTTSTTPANALPPGVTIGGVNVGGLAPEAASAAVQQAFTAPIVLRYDATRITIAPDLLGAVAAVDRALSRAQAAPPNTAVSLPVSVRRAKIAAFLARVAPRFDRKPVDAQLVLRNFKPVVTLSRLGRTLDVKQATSAIAAQLVSNRRKPITLTGKTIKPAVPSINFASIIVIRRSSNLLSLYDRMRLVKQFGVATGQRVYPTPLGRFQIVVKWKNPWWYPPASPWAAGEKPTPPGPGNPLGTRWMGLSSPGVGIHGTPQDGSIGYSVSHGCIRMHIPQAEWLFEHVDVGTPVFIVAA